MACAFAVSSSGIHKHIICFVFDSIHVPSIDMSKECGPIQSCCTADYGKCMNDVPLILLIGHPPH